MKINQSFPRPHRLTGKLQFAAVYDAKTKVVRGPLVVFSLPNDLPHPRMGISISRKVGLATKRTKIKRLIREAFRLRERELPRGYDLVIVVRPHEVFTLPEYQQIMNLVLAKTDTNWQKSLKK